MRRLIKKITWVICAVVVIMYYFSVNLLASVGVRAYVDKSQVCKGRELTLTIELSGNIRSYSAPNVTSIPGARIYGQGSSQQISLINGKMTNQISFSYILLPIQTGQLKIPSFNIKINGRYYSTQPINITVISCANQQPALSQIPLRVQNLPSAGDIAQHQNNGENTFAIASLDKDKVYIGQPIILTYTIYTRERIAFKGFAKEPNFEGFVKEEVDPGPNMNRREVIIGGKRYIAADVMKFVLIPTETGKLEIDPGQLLITRTTNVKNLFNDFFSDSFWDSFFADDLFTATRPYRLSLAPREVIVKPLPENGKPKHFSGLIGEFSISTKVDRTTVKVGDSITLSIIVKGTGPLSSLKDLPLDNLKDVRVYKSSSVESKQVLKDTIIYKKKFEYILIPEKEGELTIPPIKISYFSPDENKYEYVSTDKININVLPSNRPISSSKLISLSSTNASHNNMITDTGVESVSKDINYIKSRLTFDPFYGFWQKFWIINILIALLVIGFSFRNTLFVFSSSLNKMSNTRKTIENLLKKLEKEDDEKNVITWKSLFISLMNFASIYYHHNISTLRELTKYIERDKKIDRQTVEEMKKALPELEAILYGGSTLTKDKKDKILTIVKRILSKWH